MSCFPDFNKLTNITYDASGSITNDGTRTYSYNTENRLKTLSKDGVTANYVYNALNQRVKKQIGNDITYFSYDEQGKLVSELDKDGKLIREYIYLGNQPIGLFTKEKQGELLQIHTDHLGTPRAVTNANKEILWRWEGDQFGDVAPQIAQIKMPLRHAGQYYDSESGLFYNWHRYYDPKNGRYITSDPIGLAGGLNTFGYVGGSPLHWNDPTGLVYGLGNGPYGQSNMIKRNSRIGIFGPVCGAEGSWQAIFLVPDVWWKKACAAHDKCYATCGKSKQECDNEFTRNGARLYSWGLTKVFKKQSQAAYDNAQKKAGCNGCDK